MSVDCGMCTHWGPNPYSMSCHAAWCCRKPDGRKCPKGYSFSGGRIYDGILPYPYYTAEEIWKDAIDIESISLVKRQQFKKEIITMTRVKRE